MAIEDRNLTVGTRLVASYRKQAHACMVERAEEGEGILFVLEDGRKFKSASSAASAVMGAARRSTAGASGPSKASRQRHRKEARSLKRRPQSQRGSSTASRIRRG